MRPGICLYIHQAINPIVTLGTIQIKNPYNTLYCCANCNIIAGDLKLCIKENNPKKNPTIHPTLGPATIAPIIVGTCKIVALILQIFYNYILSKIEHLTSQMEESAISLLDSVMRYKLKNSK